MVIFFMYKDNMLFLCVNKSREAYLGFHRCLQSIIYFLPGLAKSLGLVHFQAGKETIKTRLTKWGKIQASHLLTKLLTKTSKQLTQ